MVMSKGKQFIGGRYDGMEYEGEMIPELKVVISAVGIEVGVNVWYAMFKSKMMGEDIRFRYHHYRIGEGGNYYYQGIIEE